MNTFIPKHWLAISMMALTGCGVVDSVATVEGDEDPPNQGISQALTSFSFDSAALATRPSAALPTAVLTRDRLTTTNIASRLLVTTEAPTRLSTAGTTEMFKTTSWEFEQDSASGRVVGISSAVVGPAVALDEVTLQKQSLDRLKSYGIGTGEVGRVLQRKVVSQDLQGTTLARPTVHSHKTFVYRAINGIPVVGHRAVISHGLDGKVRRVMVSWPPLAKSGHALRTQLTTADIQTRAADALAKSGETTGKASLFWRYLPTKNANGEVVLKLSAAAHIDGVVDTDGTTEEARIIDVDVSAIP